MIFLMLSIISTVVLFLLFKEFQKKNIDTSEAITFNYIFGSLIAYLFYPVKSNISDIIYADWIFPAIILGVLFVIMFNVMAMTTQKLGISIASTAAKMSLIIPVILTYILQENINLSYLKLSGILLGLISVYFTFKKDYNISSSFKIAIILFFGAGILDSSLDIIRNKYLYSDNDFLLFIITVFFIAFISGLLKIIATKKHIKPKNIIAGISLAIPNYFSIYFVLKSLEILGAIIVFPILNIGVVLASSILSWLFYKEHISKINWLGIILACLSIFLILTF